MELVVEKVLIEISLYPFCITRLVVITDKMTCKKQLAIWKPSFIILKFTIIQ
jgi:hypothetical protein